QPLYHRRAPLRHIRARAISRRVSPLFPFPATKAPDAHACPDRGSARPGKRYRLPWKMRKTARARHERTKTKKRKEQEQRIVSWCADDICRGETAQRGCRNFPRGLGVAQGIACLLRQECTTLCPPRTRFFPVSSLPWREPDTRVGTGFNEAPEF